MAELYLKAPQDIPLVKFEDIVSEHSSEGTIKELVRKLGVDNPNMKEALAKLNVQYQQVGSHHSPLNATHWKFVLGDDRYNFVVAKSKDNMRLLGYDEA